jgi:hypothetical protein
LGSVRVRHIHTLKAEVDEFNGSDDGAGDGCAEACDAAAAAILDSLWLYTIHAHACLNRR